MTGSPKEQQGNPRTSVYTARTLVTGALVTCLLLAGCQNKPAEVGGRVQKPVTADGFIVKPQSVSETIEVPGSLIPEEETDLRPEVSGRIVQLNISEGTTVPKGTLLVKLFDEDLKTQLKKLEVQLQIAEKSRERQEALLKIQGISQEDYDLTALNVDNLKIDIEATRIALSKTEIRAPYSGKLGLRNVSLGSYISSADIITSIRRVDRLKLAFAIPEKYAKRIEKGYRVSFKVDGGEKDHEARVVATENSVDATTRTLMIHALVEEHHRELIPGLFARVKLELGQTDQALMIPSQAIIPQARNKQVIRYRNDSIQFTEVETGIRDSSYVQVTRGLKAGDTVIISGLMAIRPSSKINLVEIHSYK